MALRSKLEDTFFFFFLIFGASIHKNTYPFRNVLHSLYRQELGFTFHVLDFTCKINGMRAQKTAFILRFPSSSLSLFFFLFFPIPCFLSLAIVVNRYTLSLSLTPHSRNIVISFWLISCTIPSHNHKISTWHWDKDAIWNIRRKYCENLMNALSKIRSHSSLRQRRVHFPRVYYTEAIRFTAIAVNFTQNIYAFSRYSYSHLKVRSYHYMMMVEK